MKINYFKISNFKSAKDVELSCQDYNLLIGKNNAGKSNIINAIRFFFDDYKPTHEDFYSDSSLSTDQIWVEAEYEADEEYELSDLPEKYKLENNKYRVRKSINKLDLKAKYQGYTLNENGDEKLESTSFFGARNVSKSKLGDMIYIPALKNVNDEIKAKGNTAFAKIIKEILNESIEDSEEYKEYESVVGKLSDLIRGQDPENKENRQYKCFSEIEGAINEDLASWNCKLSLNLMPLNPEILTQQSADIKLVEPDLNPMEPEKVGHGLQRALLISLIKLWGEAERKKKIRSAEEDDKKIYNSSVKLLLFEEPEVFLHPPQQKNLFHDLKLICEKTDTQIVVSTHSSNFFEDYSEDFNSINKVVKINNVTEIYSVSDSWLSSLIKEEDKDKFKYSLWLNAERNSAFFSDLVIIVEGMTDRILYTYLLKKNYESIKNKSICIFDAGLKSNIAYFMCLFGKLQIDHVVVHDRDNLDRPNHRQWNENIQKYRSEKTKKIIVVEENIEDYLGVEGNKSSLCKNLNMVEHIRNTGLFAEQEKFLFECVLDYAKNNTA